MKKKLLALFMGSALILGACGGGGGGDTTKPAENNGGGETAAPSANSADAEKLYGQSCASCHGQNLEGGVGPELTAIGSKMDAAGIESVIANGQGIMSAGLLQGEDATAVAEWLATKK